MDEQQATKPVDILFVVPDRFVGIYRRAIKLALWTLEIEKTVEVTSADWFVHEYKDMSGEEMDAALSKRCVAFVNSGDIAKREWKEFEPVRQKLHDYYQVRRQEQS